MIKLPPHTWPYQGHAIPFDNTINDSLYSVNHTTWPSNIFQATLSIAESISPYFVSSYRASHLGFVKGMVFACSHITIWSILPWVGFVLLTLMSPKAQHFTSVGYLHFLYSQWRKSYIRTDWIFLWRSNFSYQRPSSDLCVSWKSSDNSFIFS